MIITKRRTEEASFDLTPMIDVVMLLIVFFTLTSQFSRTEQKPLDLPPEKGDPGRQPPEAAVFIDMDETGALSILGEPTDARALAATRKLGDDPSAVTVIVRAHRKCPAAKLNELAAALRAAGFVRWKLGTAPEGGAG